MVNEVELRQILIQHATRYPAMQPTDAVKLLYQGEFGGGHLISDPARTLAYLVKELQATPPDATAPLTEPIGNGLVRLSLAASRAHSIPAERINDAFVRSASHVAGSLPCFLEKLQILQQLTKEGAFAFSEKELADYLDTYAAQGYPMVSHSETYRAHYHPAYRVLCTCALEQISPMFADFS